MALFVQGSDRPVIIGDVANGINLECKECKQVLVENYFEHCYIGISFQCARCGAVTTTPSLDPGEVLPQKFVRLNGVYPPAGKPVNARPGVAMVSLAEAEASAERLTLILREVERPFEITPSGVARLLAEYNRLSGGVYRKQKDIYGRLPVAKARDRFPFIWSVDVVTRALQRRVIDQSDGATNVALTNLYYFNRIVRKWAHYPRFERTMKELKNGPAFYHTIGQFLVAEYLIKSGNWVGFSVDEQHGQAIPDLYLRFTGDEKFFIEVKAVEKLNWRELYEQPSPEVVRQALNNLLRKGNQINRDKKGIVAIVSNMPPQSMAEFIKRSLDHFFAQYGRNRGSMAGCFFIQWGGISISSDRDLVRGHFEVTTVANPHWRHGENPIKRSGEVVRF